MMFHGDMCPLFSERPPLVVNHTMGVFDRHFNPLLSRGGNVCWSGNFAIEEYLNLPSQRESEIWR